MTLWAGIASAVAGGLAKSAGSALFGDGSDGQQTGSSKKRRLTSAEKVALHRGNIESGKAKTDRLGGKKWQKANEEQRRLSMIQKKKPLKSAESKADYYRKLLIDAKRAASGTPTGVAYASSISKPKLKQV